MNNKNFFKIYLWQGVAFILNFLSMFIVTPYLTKDPSTYGIYVVCISFTIFLSYADLGFVSAGQKYAAEYFSRSEKKEEIEIIGFTSFILLLFLIICMIFFTISAISPHILLKNIDSDYKIEVASKLLLILTLAAPLTVLQRVTQMIFSIRLEDYIIQRIFTISGLIKILSVLFFFKSNNYNIVGYFLFVQVINFLSYLVFLIIAKARYKYDLVLLIRSIRFNKQIFNKTKKLAFASLFITISWIIYFELDSIFIGKFIGVEFVALYAIGLSFISFFRTVFGVLFSPIGIKFNHYIGRMEFKELKSFYLKIIIYSAPLVIFPIISFVFLIKPFIINWVGYEFYQTINIAIFLLLSNIFAFISYPSGMLIVAQEKIKSLYALNVFLPIFFWFGIFISFNKFGVFSFAIFKFLSFIISAIFYFIYTIKFLETDPVSLLVKIFKPMIFSLIFLITILPIINLFLPIAKSKINLIFVLCAIGVSTVSALLIYVFSNKELYNIKNIRIQLK